MNNTGTKQVSVSETNCILKRKNGEYRACLKYSVPVFVEQIYKMQRLEVSGAVRPIYGSLVFKRLSIRILEVTKNFARNIRHVLLNAW